MKKLLLTGINSDIAEPIKAHLQTMENIEVYATYYRQSEMPDFVTRSWQVDFSNQDQTQQFCDELQTIGITHYIQLHGIGCQQDQLEKNLIENWDFHLDVNLKSVAMIIQSLLSQMTTQKFGRIVLMNTASSNFGGGLNGFTYGLSKYGIGYLTKHLARHYTKYQILTNCISPGFIATKFHTNILGRSPEQLENRANFVPLKRPGTAEDVAQVILQLTFQNEFISGENIKIDGGDFL